MRLDLPPAFFLGAYIRLAMLGTLGLFVLGVGATFAMRVRGDVITTDAATAQFGVALMIVSALLFTFHALWLGRAPKTEHEPFLRRAHATLGALAFLAGFAVFAPLALARALAAQPMQGEASVALLSLALAAFFAWRLRRDFPA